MSVCKEEDDFVREKLHWIVTLSNGERIYQDDDRPGELEPKAWPRLRKYVEDNDLAITNFHIRFYDHIEEAAPSHAPGYYFVNRAEAVAFSGDPAHTIRSYMVGILNDNEQIELSQWVVPAIIKVGTEIRDVTINDPKLIVA